MLGERFSVQLSDCSRCHETMFRGKSSPGDVVGSKDSSPLVAKLDLLSYVHGAIQFV